LHGKTTKTQAANNNMTVTDWLASTFGTAVILSALIGGFWRIIIDHITVSVKSKYDKELATHVDELRHKTDLALKDFEREAHERSIKLTGVFTPQREVIENTYAKILALHNSLEEFSVGIFGDDPATKSNVVSEAFKEFAAYYYPKAIYLPESTVSKVALLTRAADRLARNLNQTRILNRQETQSHNETLSINKLMEKRPELEREVGDSFKAVIDEFQSILGVKAIVKN